MKEIKAFIHKNRLPDVAHSLKKEGFNKLSITEVKGMLSPLDSLESDYSLDIGERVITEIKLELVCSDDRFLHAIDIIEKNAQTGQAEAGVIYVSEILMERKITKLKI